MRILYLSSRNQNKQGVVIDPRVSKTTDTLIDAGHSVEFLGWERDGIRGECTTKTFRGRTVKVNLIPLLRHKKGLVKRLLDTLKFQKLLKKWLISNKDKYDVIHAHDFDTAFTAVKCSKKTGKKVVYDIGDYYADSHKLPFILDKMVRKRDTKTINNAYATIICSEERIEQIAPAKPQKLIVTFNAPSHVELKQGENLYDAKGRFVIVYIGTLGTDRLLFEAINVVKNDSSLFLLLGGYADEDERQPFKKAIGDADNILFSEFLSSYNEVLYQESLADVILGAMDIKTANYKYTAPNKFGESMLLGKPIIVSKDSSIDKVVEKYDVGVVIDYSEEGLKEGIQKLKSMTPAQKEEMSARAKKLFDEVYCWEKSAGKIVKLYEELEQDLNL